MRSRCSVWYTVARTGHCPNIPNFFVKPSKQNISRGAGSGTPLAGLGNSPVIHNFFSQAHQARTRGAAAAFGTLLPEQDVVIGAVGNPAPLGPVQGAVGQLI